MTDERKTIGSGGKPGRGNRQTSPSAAARSLAGGAPSSRPVAKAKKTPAAPPAAAKKKASTKPAAKIPRPARPTADR
ncbi:MAG: glycerol acyltransferase, partial [Aeromicrobium sp.]|nr:glycerol acyltransferase [Aeromicrobium sp.]